jgi:hypothetical protein
VAISIATSRKCASIKTVYCEPATGQGFAESRLWQSKEHLNHKNAFSRFQNLNFQLFLLTQASWISTKIVFKSLVMSHNRAWINQGLACEVVGLLE